MLFCCVLALALGAGCQGRSEPDLPRPTVIEARVAGAVTARVTVGHPCRAEVDSDELLVGSSPLVAQVGNSRWAGDDAGVLSKDGRPIVRMHDQANGIDVLDPAGVVLVSVSSDGVVANATGVVLRRAAVLSPSGSAANRGSASGEGTIKVGDATVTGTSDAALAAVLTAPELIPEVRALAACRRLFAMETK